MSIIPHLSQTMQILLTLKGTPCMAGSIFFRLARIRLPFAPHDDQERII